MPADPGVHAVRGAITWTYIRPGLLFAALSTCCGWQQQPLGVAPSVAACLFAGSLVRWGLFLDVIYMEGKRVIFISCVTCRSIAVSPRGKTQQAHRGQSSAMCRADSCSTKNEVRPPSPSERSCMYTHSGQRLVARYLIAGPLVFPCIYCSFLSGGAPQSNPPRCADSW